MKWSLLLAALAGFILSAASPPRGTGLDIPTAQSIAVLTACIEHKLGQFKESPLPNGGISIQFGGGDSLLIQINPTLFFDISDSNDTRHIVVRYRHPMSKGTAAKDLRRIGRMCFPYELEAAAGGVLPES